MSEDGERSTEGRHPGMIVDNGWARALLGRSGDAAPAATRAFESAIAREVRRDAEDNGRGLGAAAKRRAMPKRRVQKLSKHDAVAFRLKLRWYILSVIASGEIRLPATPGEIQKQLMERSDGLYKTAMHHGLCGKKIVWGLITDRLLVAEKQGRHSVVTGVHQDEIVRRLVDAIMTTLTSEIGHPASLEEIERLIANNHPKLLSCARENSIRIASVAQILIDRKQLRQRRDSLIEPVDWHWRSQLDTPDRLEDFVCQVSEWLYLRLVTIANEVLRENALALSERQAFLCDLVVFRPITMTLADFKAEVWEFGLHRAREIETRARLEGVPLQPVRYMSIAASPLLRE